MKLEPREVAASPYIGYAGNYRDPSQTTPSPQPLSPQMFAQVSPSPSPYNILQHQLQAPRPLNNFVQQTPNLNEMFTPNIAINNAIWNNPSEQDATNRAIFNQSNMLANSSSIFNQPLPLSPATNLTQNFNINSPMANSSILTDLDNQLIIDGLSGDLQSFNLSDYTMESLTKFDKR